ncbi:MAG TPA: transposase [Patescibacteria group bacterium]|nr:transposase [Patescibacteria group bacterium]
MYHIQTSLFYDLQELVRNSSLLRKYYYLFKALDLSILADRNHGVGRTGHSQHAILRAFIVKHLEQIKSVPQLIHYIEATPPLLELCGFTLGDMPDESQFYRFQTDTDNAILKNIHHRLNQRLVEQGLVSLDTLIIDSKPVMAATKENNFKNPARNTTNKTKKPVRNPAATLSYYSCQIINGKKENMVFFWGYRTHVIISKEGFALVEITLPNNITDQEAAYKLLRELKRRYKLKKGFLFLADKAYDVRDLYTFIVQQLKGNPYIPINPRNQKDDKTFGPHGCPICQGGLEMKSTGRWTEANRDRLKFRCPLKTAKKKTAAQKQVCPANHPSFDTGKCYGCTKYLDVTDDARARVPRDSKEFKKTFKNRQFVEQYFARLGDREVEQTTHYTFKTVRNQMTIAHLTASLIGVAAAILLKQPEKMRCHKTFAQPPTQRMTG